MKHIKPFVNKENLEDRLCYAIQFYNFEEFEYLIKEFKTRNYSFDYVDNSGWTPLTIAVYKHRKDMIEILLKNGADINFGNNIGDTPLMIAGENNNLSMLIYLIEAGADWSIENEMGDFMFFTNDEYIKIIIEDYPEKYKEYLAKKDAQKYNL